MLFRKLLRFGYKFLSQVCDPVHAVRGLLGMAWYISDYREYKDMPGAETIRLTDMYPIVQNRKTHHEIDAHYFYVNSWAMRAIIKENPRRHVDIASQAVLAALLSAVVPVTYVDYRSLDVRLNGLECVAGSITELPFGNESITSLSCLHVAEHIGLGRYGDPLDPRGTQKASDELQRVLAPGGSLYFSVPVGRERICFNAHRVHSTKSVVEYFNLLELVEFSGVSDEGSFAKTADFLDFHDSDYACGMFHFKKYLHE